jgi:hypothetical protein
MIELTEDAERSAANGGREKVPEILDRELQVVIDDRLSRVDQDAEPSHKRAFSEARRQTTKRDLV